MSRSFVATWLLVGVLRAAAVGAAEPPSAVSEKPAARTDLYGDPLPDGAIARLGTTRFRHGGAAWALAYSPDGKTLAARTWDRIILYDTATGREIGRYPKTLPIVMGHTLAFMPDGKSLLFVEDVGKLTQWNLTDAQSQRTFTASSRQPGEQQAEMQIAPDGKSIATTSSLSAVSLFDVRTGKELCSIGRHNSQICSLAFSPDSRQIALGALHAVHLWDAERGTLLRSVELHKDRFVFSSSFSPDGTTLARGTWDRITLLDPNKGTVLTQFEVAGMSAVNGLEFTPDGKTLLSISQTRHVRCWDLATKKEKYAVDTRMGFCRSLALNPAGQIAAVGTTDSAIRLFDVSSGRELFTDLEGHDARVNVGTFATDGRKLLTGGGGDGISAWDVSSWQRTARMKERANTVSISPNGMRMAALAPTGVAIWDAQSGKKLLTVEMQKPPLAAELTAGGERLVTLDWTEAAQPSVPGTTRFIVWEATTGKQLRAFAVSAYWPVGFAVDAPGKIAAVSADKDLALYDLERGREYARLPGHTLAPYGLAFSADGRLLLSGSHDKTARLWETASGKEVLRYESHPSPIQAVALTLDSRLAAISPARLRLFADGALQQPKEIHVWDTVSGRRLAIFRGFSWELTCLAFSPDGTQLLSGFIDGTALVWDTASAMRSARERTKSLSVSDMTSLWSDLAGSDAPKAYQAIGFFAQSPRDAVPFIREKLRPAAGVDAQRVARLIAALDSTSFAERAKASKELEALEDLAARQLTTTLQGKPPAETRKRCEYLLEQLGKPLPQGEVLRSVRAVQALERIATADAKQLLQTLAVGAPDARLTREAKESLERLARHP
jgi:WD40 repeat protein